MTRCCSILLHLAHFCCTSKLQFILPVLRYTDFLWVCQNCGYSTSPMLYHQCFCIWYYLFARSVFTLSGESCNLQTYVVWFYVVSKGNHLWCHQMGCLIRVKFEQRITGNQIQAHLAVQQQQHAYLFISFFFLSFLLFSEESFAAQHEGLKQEKESLTKLQKECTAKRSVATCN